MRFYHNLLNAVIAGLKQILHEGRQADVVVEELIATHPKWGSRDRNFVAENIYNVVRYKRVYEYCTHEKAETLYFHFLLGAKLLLRDSQFPAEWDFIDLDNIIIRYEEAKQIRKIRESIPDWMDELGVRELGESWDAEIAALNQQAQLSTRVNTLKTSRQQVVDALMQEGIEIGLTQEAPDAVIIKKRKSLRNHPFYKDGLLEIQDVSSQQVAPMLDAQPGMKVIDACAGAGGKTLHIAAYMHNQGKITALDISEHKLSELKRRAARAGATIITTRLADSDTIAGLKESADRLLLDVPCSGLGVLRRKPDAKWKLTPEFIEDIKQTQASILDNYSTMLKRGGIMVYSTCSILPSENEQQVAAFIKRQAGAFKLLEDKKISPAQSGFDGFYMAKLLKV